MADIKTITCDRCNTDNTEVRSFIVHKDNIKLKVHVCQSCLASMFKSLKKDDSILEGDVYDWKASDNNEEL